MLFADLISAQGPGQHLGKKSLIFPCDKTDSQSKPLFFTPKQNFNENVDAVL